MQRIVVDVVGAQQLQLPVEDGFSLRHGVDAECGHRCGQHKRVAAAIGKSLAEHPFAVAVGISPCRVEKRHSGIGGALHNPNALLAAIFPPVFGIDIVDIASGVKPLSMRFSIGSLAGSLTLRFKAFRRSLVAAAAHSASHCQCCQASGAALQPFAPVHCHKFFLHICKGKEKVEYVGIFITYAHRASWAEKWGCGCSPTPIRRSMTPHNIGGSVQDAVPAGRRSECRGRCGIFPPTCRRPCAR